MKVALLGVIWAVCVLTRVTAIPQSAQRPFAPTTPPKDDYPIVSEDTTRYIDHLRKRYGLKGLTIALVKAGPAYGEQELEWVNQTISLGEADVAGSAVTEEVSDCSASSISRIRRWH